MTFDCDHEQVPDLETLGRVRFSDLTEAEIKLLHAVPTGGFAVCGGNMNSDDPANEPGKADEWGTDRQIRAALIRWLCVDRLARECVDPKGIQVFGAKITGPLDLSFVAVPFRLAIVRCRLAEDVELLSSIIPSINLQGTWVRSIKADGAVVNGGVFLRNGFRTEGAVRLVGAQIRGNLECDNAMIVGPSESAEPGSGGAIRADGINVTGGIYLRGGFRALGEVRLLGARIGGDLTCTDAMFANPPQSGVPGSGSALSADGARIAGSVFLSAGFRAEGEVRFIGAEIGSDLVCARGMFVNPFQAKIPGGGTALNADRINVKSGVFFSDGFRAVGEVRLRGAHVGRNFDCTGASFTNLPQSGVPQTGKVLVADGIGVEGDVFLRDGFRAQGEVRLVGAQIDGDLDCGRAAFHGELAAHRAQVKGAFFWAGIADSNLARLSLVNASAAALSDDRQSWPAQGNLILDGFVYGRISAGPKDAKTRLDWLAREKQFMPQPYRQLARVLRDEGDDRGARRVLSKMEHSWRAQENTERDWFDRFWRSAWNAILRCTVGYGYHPGRSLLFLLGLVIIGLTFFRAGYAAGGITPIDKEAYCRFKQTSQLPPHYDRFNPLIYSLENSFPLIKLGQVDRWQPDPNPQTTVQGGGSWVATVIRSIISTGFLRWFRWGQICLGWFFATMGLAAVTGIVRKE